jgi:hypothetical protein
MNWILDLAGRFSYWISHDPAATAWREWLNFAVSVAIAIIAIWQDRIRAWFTRPKVSLIVQTGSPFSDLTVLDAQVAVQNPDGTLNVGVVGSARCYYFRVLVKNSGKATAKHVEVFVQSVKRMLADESEELLKDFPPMNLKWAHSGGVEKDLSPGMSRFVDLGFVLDPRTFMRQPTSLRHQFQKWNMLEDKTKTIFTFELEVMPHHLGHIVEGGRYRIQLLTSGENFDPFETLIEMNFSGDWFDTEDEMYQQVYQLNTVTSSIGLRWDRFLLKIGYRS